MTVFFKLFLGNDRPYFIYAKQIIHPIPFPCKEFFLGSTWEVLYQFYFGVTML
jgi:hypothetical protein